MLTTNYMWHPAGEARQYEATGSRIAFHDRWNTDEKHNVQREDLLDALQTMVDVLTAEQKARWLGTFEPSNPNPILRNKH